MSFFKKKNPVNQLDPFISVNCDIKAEISNRVALSTQNIEFAQDPNSDLISLIGRSYENGFRDSKKGIIFVFSRNIESGTYALDKNSPFEELYYYESAANDDFTTFYIYKPENGSVTVKVLDSTAEKLSYTIDFDFKGSDQRTETLRIVGKATFNVFFRNQ